MKCTSNSCSINEDGLGCTRNRLAPCDPRSPRSWRNASLDELGKKLHIRYRREHAIPIRVERDSAKPCTTTVNFAEEDVENKIAYRVDELDWILDTVHLARPVAKFIDRKNRLARGCCGLTVEQWCDFEIRRPFCSAIVAETRCAAERLRIGQIVTVQVPITLSIVE